MKTILTNGRTLICVSVQKEAKDFEIIDSIYTDFKRLLYDRGDGVGVGVDIGEGEYKIIGTVLNSSGSTVLDFDPEPFVEEVDYKMEHDHWHSLSPTDSFLSLLESHGMLLKNPMGEKPDGKYFRYGGQEEVERVQNKLLEIAQWQSFEDKVIKKLVIIEKI